MPLIVHIHTYQSISKSTSAAFKFLRIEVGSSSQESYASTQLFYIQRYDQFKHKINVQQHLVDSNLSNALIAIGIMQLKSLSLQCLLIICLTANARMVCIYPTGQRHSMSDCISFESLFEEQVWPPGTSLEFSGIYSLSNDSTISSMILVRDTSNISLLGDTFSLTVIECNGRLGFAFINVTNLTIANVQFLQCGVPVDGLKEAFEMQTDSMPAGTKAAHFLANVHTLSMANVSISKSRGYGILCVNLYGESYIIRTNFTYNSVNGSESPAGGSTFLLYEGGASCDRTSESTWIIFSDNVFHHSSHTFDTFGKHNNNNIEASCLLIVVNGTCCFIHVDVAQSVFANNFVPIVAVHDLSMLVSYEIEIQSSNFTNSLERLPPVRNTATIMYISASHAEQKEENTCLSGNKTMVRDIRIYDCKFDDAQIGQLTGYGYLVMNLLFSVSIVIEKCVFLPNIIQPAIIIWPANPGTRLSKLISIDKCSFMGLRFSAIGISSDDNRSLSIKITNSVFRNISYTALSIVKKLPDMNDQLSVLIENTTFIHNTYHSLYASQVNNLTLAGNEFIENYDTPVVCEGSKVYVSGITYFVGNKGSNGGALSLSTAMYLYRHSNKWEASPPLLYLQPDARLILENNKASNRGGAIFVDSSNLYNLYSNNKHAVDYHVPCFYQLASQSKLIKRVRKKWLISHIPKIIFVNNTAGFAGDSIFGGLYTHCDLKTSLRTRINFEVIINISHPLSPSEMAGDPNIICPCMGFVADCSQQLLHVSVHQGQSIRVYAIATRAKNHYANYGATPALVNTWIDQSQFDARMGKGQSAHKLDNKCSEILFSIYSRESFVEVMISLSGEAMYSESIEVTLSGCPFGFQLEDSRYPGCICDSIIQQSGCTCTIDNLTILCPFGKWIGNISNNAIVHHHCPLDYCTAKRGIKVTDALDDQCVHNRSGVLCGECQPGLSLILGSSKCEQCSNMYLFLFIPFVLAGLGLVLLLYCCNFTVSRGTVNGLIYFANVVQVNSSIFITQNTSRFLTVFIAWLNLDFGIQTCFFSGMDMYAKAWLQFVFPVYMWLIVAAIVLLSRHSLTITRLTRHNTIPVLATLFLLSYAKLLRAINTAFSFTYLRYPDGTHIPVWMYDGNVPFAKGKHTALLIAALVAMLGFIIPYTLLLLLSPYLQMWSHHKPLRWMNKLKPFLDANYGPYKNKTRNWTGIILLVRAVQFTCFAANAKGDPNINLMVILLIGVAPYLVVWTFGTVYKSKANSILESAFILLLSILASASLYIRTISLDVGGKQTAITSSIFAAAFSLFLIIIAYHLFMLIKSKISKLTKGRNFLRTITPDTSATELSNGRANDQKFSVPSVSYVALSELTPPSDD